MQGLPRKALQIIDDASIGGGQRHVLSLSDGLRKRGWHVEVACAPAGWLVEELKSRGIPHHGIEISNRPSISSLRAVGATIRRVDPAVVHTHGSTAGFYGRVAARLRRTSALIHTYHGLHYLRGNAGPAGGLFKTVDSILARWTDRIICVSDSDRQVVVRNGLASERQTVVIKVGIDPGPFLSISQQPAGPRPFIGTIGRLHPQKGHAYLIDALKRVRDSGISAELEIVGDGELRHSLKEQIEERGLSSAVHLPGAETDAPALLARFDLFVLPSLWEGLPYVLLEAMAAARPIVASNVDGISEAITDGVEGILVTPGDPDALANAIRRVLDDPTASREMGRRARERIGTDFAAEGMIRRIATLYEEAVASAPPREEIPGR